MPDVKAYLFLGATGYTKGNDEGKIFKDKLARSTQIVGFVPTIWVDI